jgi:hypothetical protein
LVDFNALSHPDVSNPQYTQPIRDLATRKVFLFNDLQVITSVSALHTVVTAALLIGVLRERLRELDDFALSDKFLIPETIEDGERDFLLRRTPRSTKRAARHRSPRRRIVAGGDSPIDLSPV